VKLTPHPAPSADGLAKVPLRPTLPEFWGPIVRFESDHRTPLGRGQTYPPLGGNDCDCRSPSLADDTYSRSGRYLPPAACFLPSQVPFSVSLDHLPESSPFLSFPVNW